MNIYFSTFITGFSEVIKKFLTLLNEDLKILSLDDGLVVYQTSLSIDQITRLRYFNNSFLLIKRFDQDEAEEIIRKIIDDPEIDHSLTLHIFQKRKSFRLRFVKENEPIRVEKNPMEKLEQYIQDVTHLQINRSGADVEFWLMTRKEGFTLFGIRLTSHGNYEKILEKGELRPELSHILCLLSEPRKDDVFLDPFCGSGSIPIARAKSSPSKLILAGDINPQTVDSLRQKIKSIKLKIVLGRWDATNLRTFHENSVDKIVTDPPWGLGSLTHIDIDKLYNGMLAEFDRVLRLDGLLIILTAQKELFEKLVQRYPSLIISENYSTLVNGKKASVYKMKKVS